MAGGAGKCISITPEPRHGDYEESSFLTGVSEQQLLTPEVLQVCASLGIHPAELQPKSISDFQSSASRLASEARLQHYEELRKAKWLVIRKELSKRRTLKSAPAHSSTKFTALQRPDLPPVLPLSAVGQLGHRLEYVSSRIDTTRRVNENQARLIVQQERSQSALSKQYFDKMRKLEENRRNRDLELREKAQILNKRREEIVEKLRKMREMKEKAEIRKAKIGQNSQKHEEKSLEQAKSSLEEPSASDIEESWASCEEFDQIGSQLAQIDGKLAKSALRAEAKLIETKRNLRHKLEAAQLILQNRVKSEALEEEKLVTDITKLRNSAAKHSQNRQQRLQETIARLAALSRKAAEKTHQTLLSRHQLVLKAEQTYSQKEALRLQKIEQSAQRRYQESLERSQRSEQRQGLAEEYRELIHELRVNERERLIMKWKRTEQSLCEIKEVRERVRTYQEKANFQLKEERERRLRSLSREKRPPSILMSP